MLEEAWLIEKKMATQISAHFIEQALSSQTPFPLSYADPDQKWLIRTHLISFFQDHPSFSPSFGTFFHPDGAAANLLCATGHLRPSTSSAAAPVPLTIWIHENHPFMAPVVFVSPSSDDDTIRPDHPFVRPSGRATCPYLETWSHPRSSLSTLATNLARLFSRDHPLSSAAAASAGGGGGRFGSHPSLMSKREALDRLVATVHYDLVALAAKAEEEVDALEGLRERAGERARRLGKAVSRLEEERRRLKRVGAKLAEQSDTVASFLRVNDRERIEAEFDVERVEKVFEIRESGGRRSAVEVEKVAECVAGDKAVEEVMYALDMAVKEEAVSIYVYLKQVRLLSREQFFHRAMLVKLRGPDILRTPYYS